MTRLFRLSLLASFVAVGLLATILCLPVAAAQERPHLSLADLRGQQHSLDEYRGKPIVVNFWATWCAACQHEMPLFIDLKKHYGDSVQVVTISLDDSNTRDKIGTFAVRYKMDVPILLGTVDDLKRVGLGEALPATLFLDSDGNAVARILGEASKNDLRSRLDWIVNKKGSAPPARTDNFAKRRPDDAAIHVR